MADISERIAAAGPRNAQILAVLSDTDYAPAALGQQLAFIADLQASIKQIDSNLTALDARVQKELKDHEKYRDSTVKRFAHKVGGKKSQAKFEEKASKEEREYYEAVFDKKAAEDQKEMLKAQLIEADNVRGEYEAAAKTHKEAQEELNELYDGIFGGPTPEFPEEDPKEFAVYEAEKKRNDLGTKLTRSKQALQCMAQADEIMSYAGSQVQDALSASTWDVVGGGFYADMAERNLLASASSAASKALALAAQARRLDPQIKDPGAVEIAGKNLLSDVLFDNIFTDLAFHQKIQQSEANVRLANNRLKEERKGVFNRQQDLKRTINAAEKELNDARNELQRVRQQAFETVSGSRPPAYDEAT